MYAPVQLLGARHGPASMDFPETVTSKCQRTMSDIIDSAQQNKKSSKPNQEENWRIEALQKDHP